VPAEVPVNKMGPRGVSRRVPPTIQGGGDEVFIQREIGKNRAPRTP
jgi:hypothetical protein